MTDFNRNFSDTSIKKFYHKGFKALKGWQNLASFTAALFRCQYGELSQLSDY